METTEEKKSSEPTFKVPVKCIKSIEDLAVWRNSGCFRELMNYIRAVNGSIIGFATNTLIELSPQVQRVLALLDSVSLLADQVEPIPASLGIGRFGNLAFRTWHAKMTEQSLELHKTMLGDEFALPGLAEELGPYLLDSFGNPQRIDYGTGHELHFVAWLFCLRKVGVLTEQDNKAVILRIFAQYLRLCRKIQARYKQEPAGSHGVWGLDDHQFLPFLWGAAQLIGKDTEFAPGDVLNPRKVELMVDQSLYIEAIHHIYNVKKGPFFEHSPDLYNISAAASWRKINSGMQKKYDIEVLNKFPVTQHFLFGSLLPWSSQ